jgi:hypothetical protein
LNFRPPAPKAGTLTELRYTPENIYLHFHYEANILDDFIKNVKYLKKRKFGLKLRIGDGKRDLWYNISFITEPERTQRKQMVPTEPTKEHKKRASRKTARLAKKD